MTEDNIAVAVRVRPIIKTELKKKLQEQWTVSNKEIYLTDSGYRETETFTFDYILDTSAKNEDLYKIVKPLVLSTLGGFNATIFAYGQTSSGKTHSILGNDDDPGVIPRAAQDVFSEISARDGVKHVVRVSYVEIYNEKINDLLDITNKELKLRVCDDGKGAVLVGMMEETVRNESQMMEVLYKGNKNRQIGDTKMNERSSRSHVICDVMIESSSLEDVENEGADAPVKCGHLYIVDLAGSERIAQTGATGVRMTEGMHINKSLSTLISVITQLSNNQSYVSYRDSKLTRLLANALGGNSRTLIIAAITPVSYEDTLSTLKFARSAKTIKTKPRLNELVSQQSFIKRQMSKEKELIELIIEKERIIKELRAELLESRNIYVPWKAKIVKPPARRHTMGVPSDVGYVPLEPIMEYSVGEEDENEETADQKRHSYADLKSFACNRPVVPAKTLKTDAIALDETLKEYSSAEVEGMIQEKVRSETARLLQENEKIVREMRTYKEECMKLKQTYESLDVSHISTAEFVKIERDIAVEERNQLQKQVDDMQKVAESVADLKAERDALKEKLAVMEAEQEFLQASQNQQLQRRCDELVARVEELQQKEAQGHRPVPVIVTRDSKELERLRELQEKCDKLEASIKLAEMHSKILRDENSALKGCKRRLVRSTSETCLAQACGAEPQQEEPTRDDFQRIFKGLRRLTSTIISGAELSSTFASPSAGGTPYTPLPCHLGRMRTSSEKPSFGERMSTGLQAEENEELKKENAMLKEHTNELLAKLKSLNDKLNRMDNAALEMQVKKLQEEKEGLLGKLAGSEQKDGEQRGEVKVKDEEYLRELEGKVKMFEEDVKTCEELVKGQQMAKEQVEVLTNELALLKREKDEDRSGALIVELREKLQLGNEAFQEKESHVKILQEELQAKQGQEEELKRALQAALGDVKVLEDKIHSTVEDIDRQGEDARVIDDLKQAVEDRQREIEGLHEKLVQRQNEHDMDKEALEYSSSELDEAMATIIALKKEHYLAIDQLKKELSGYVDHEKHAQAQIGKLAGLEEDLKAAKLAVAEGNSLLEQCQSDLTRKTEECDECQERLEESRSELLEVKDKIEKLQDDFDQFARCKDQGSDEYAQLNDLLKQKEEVLGKLQQELDSTRMTIEDVRGKAMEEMEGKDIEIDRLTSMLAALEEDARKMQACQAEDAERRLQLQGLIDENEGKLAKLFGEVAQGKEECAKIKMAADGAQIKHEEEAKRLREKIDLLKDSQGERSEELAKYESLLEEREGKVAGLQEQIEQLRQEIHQGKMALTNSQREVVELNELIEAEKCEKNERDEQLCRAQGEVKEREKLVGELQEKLDSLNEYKMSAESAMENRQREIQARERALAQVKHEMELLQADLLAANAQIGHGGEEISKMRALLKEKDNLLNTLAAQYEEARQACHKYEMAASSTEDVTRNYESMLEQLKQEHGQELEEFRTKISALEQEKSSVGSLQIDIDSLRREIAKNKEAHDQQMVDLKKTHEKEAMASQIKENHNLKAKSILERERNEYRAKLEAIEGALGDARKECRELSAKCEMYEAEMNALRNSKNAQNVDIEEQFKDICQKYEKAVNQIKILEEKAGAQKVCDDSAAKSNRQFEKALALLSDEEKVVKLQNELLHKRRECDALTQSRDELQRRVDVVRTLGPTKLVKSSATRQNELIKNLESQLAESGLKLKHAEEKARHLKDEHEAAQRKIKELNEALLKNEAETKQMAARYKRERDEFIANNQPQTNQLDEVTMDAIRNKIIGKEEMHARVTAAMNEDFERKYRAYSEKYAMLKKASEAAAKSKDGLIKQLEAKLEDSNKENQKIQQTAGGEGNLLEANKFDANLKIKIHDLQQQLQAARLEGSQKCAKFEAQISKLHEEYREKLNAKQVQLDALRLKPNYVPFRLDVNSLRQREKFTRRVDAELLTIPCRLRMIERITSVEVLASACLECSHIQHHLFTLESNCHEHPMWKRLEAEVSAYKKDTLMRTDRFDLLTETRNVFVKLLELCASKESREVVIASLDGVNAQIDDYAKTMKEKESFLKFLLKELEATRDNLVAEAKEQKTVECDQCQLFKTCHHIVCQLIERIRCSLVIIDGLGNQLNPLQFCLDDAKRSDDELERLRVKFIESSSSVVRQKQELDVLKEKYQKAKRLANMRYADVKQMEAVLIKEKYSVNFDVNPIKITKVADELRSVDEDNPRPFTGRSRDSGRKSIGATPKHFSPFFVTPEEHKEAKQEARRHK